MSSIQTYKSWSLEGNKKIREELATSSGIYFKPKVGKNIVRFLPPIGQNDEPFQIVFEHRLPKDGRAVVFACPRMMKKEHCVACSKSDELKRSANKADQNLGYSIGAKRKIYANIIDRKTPERGVQVYGFGKTVEKQLRALADPDSGGADFTCPENGFDIFVERVGTGVTDTEYTVTGARRSSPLGDNEWLSKAHDLTKFADTTRTQDEIQEALEDCATDVAPAPRKAIPAPQPKRSSRTAEDDVLEAEFEE